jgi:uncharacterized membrane protein
MDGNGLETAHVNHGEGLAAKPSDRSRWIAAAGYIGVVCLFSLTKSKGDAFIRAHASQGVLLFIAECATLMLAVILGSTVGKIGIVGLIVVGLFDLLAGFTALVLSTVGFIKALFGEDWRMPFLGEYRHRVPGFHS